MLLPRFRIIFSLLILTSFFISVFTTNPCDPNSCLNSGTCALDHENRAICRCNIGFIGSRCQYEDPCHLSSCHNGATCLFYFPDNDESRHSPLFNCTCPYGFIGSLCEIDAKTICDRNPCENGATCQMLPSTTSSEHYACICRPGFRGENCEFVDEWCSPGQGNCSSSAALAERRPSTLDECERRGLRWCTNGGRCELTTNGAGVRCRCTDGWRGERCDVDVDECAQPDGSALCLNGGTCSNTPGGFRCICVNGWEGSRCQINHDDCQEARCYNGATCHDRVGSFNCECEPGYTGLLCHLRNACISAPCHAGAVCDTSPVDGSYVCSCPAGYTGRDCSTDVDECTLGNPCEHGGSCLNTPGSYRCLCPPGWKGMFCDQNINECASAPCMNDATCLDDVGRFICVCMPGFDGIHCEHNIDDCASKPCQNGGVCFDAVNNYTCRCPIGYYGRNCEYGLARPDLCASKPCKNNGECVELTGHYICKCAYEYYGVHCERRHLIKTTSVTAITLRPVVSTSTSKISSSVDDVITYDEIDKITLAKCLANQCAKKANNGVCDVECNYPICGYDGLDCSAGVDPFINCVAKDFCPHVFKDGKCDDRCNSEACLFDGFDCMDKSDSTCNPLYETYCIRHLGDGNCDSGCNTRGCNYDGGDCVTSDKHRSMLLGAVALVLTIHPAVFVNQSNVFLMALGKILDVNLKIKTDDKNRPMVYRWNSRDGVEGEPVPFWNEVNRQSEAPSHRLGSDVFSGVFVVLVVDITKCTEGGRADCFSKVESVANFLGASRAKEALKQELGWDIYSATSEVESSQSTFARNVWVASVAAVLVMIFFVLLVAQRKRKIVTKLWNIPGSSAAKRHAASFSCGTADKTCRLAPQNLYESDLKCCRKADCIGGDLNYAVYKLPNSHLDNYISGCHQTPNHMDADQYSESGTYSTYATESDLAVIGSVNGGAKRFKPDTTDSNGQMTSSNNKTLSTGWSNEHRAAAGLKHDVKMLSPNVNVKGPDDQTPVMVATYGSYDNEEAIRTLEQLISCGANLDSQTHTNGDTALTLGIKCQRLHAVRTMLARGADPNLSDHEGNTALHHAINVNSPDMLGAIFRHSLHAPDLELRDATGATPLIAAAKHSARCTELLELLLAHKASPAAQDEEGKTALHWAALHNDVEAVMCLIKHGANKDAADQHDQTPLMLAVREGYLDVTLALLERGASKDIVDDMDRSPLQLAIERGFDQLALVLRKWQPAPPSSFNNGVMTTGAAYGMSALQSNTLRHHPSNKPKPPKRTKSLREQRKEPSAADGDRSTMVPSRSVRSTKKTAESKMSPSVLYNACGATEVINTQPPAVGGSSPLSSSIVDPYSSSSSSSGAPSSFGGSPAMSVESPPFFGGTPSPSSCVWAPPPAQLHPCAAAAAQQSSTTTAAVGSGMHGSAAVAAAAAWYSSAACGGGYTLYTTPRHAPQGDYGFVVNYG